MTALEAYLIKLIKAQGPLSIAAYMAEALGNKTHGYYMKQDPFGQGGDFTTAPEISQMFGEIIGLWLGTNWITMNCPEKIHLIELGPGRGTLMQDAVRAMKAIPGLLDSTQLHLVEMSPALRKIQQKNLQDYPSPQWHDRINDALEQADGQPILLIANEFFDALPVRQFQKRTGGWHERLICLDVSEKLALQLAPAPISEQLIPALYHRAETGAIVEISAIAETILAQIAEYIKIYGGAALIIDYGHDSHGTGDTLQAVKTHSYQDILSQPGDVDLTCHVNFQRLKEIAQLSNLKIFGPIGQGAFLNAMAIKARSDILCAAATEQQKNDIHAALHRLTHDEAMGQIFKVMALCGNDLVDVAGFEA